MCGELLCEAGSGQSILMPRRKPISGKRKKEILQEKRRQKRERGDLFEHDPLRSPPKPRRNGRGRSRGKSKEPEKTERHLVAVFGTKNKLNTVFERESREEVQKRIADSTRPLSPVENPFGLNVDATSKDGFIPIPDRPAWNYGMSKQQVEKNEAEAMEAWLDSVYEHDRSRLNHFEHNIEVWRQLWRVCEISEILVIVIDVRHPLVHFPRSLYEYVTSTLGKPFIVVLNKIDIVPESHVDIWEQYFNEAFPKVHTIPFTSRSLDQRGKRIQFRRNRSGMKKKWHAIGGKELLTACVEISREHMGLECDIDWESALSELAEQYESAPEKEEGAEPISSGEHDFDAESTASNSDEPDATDGEDSGTENEYDGDEIEDDGSVVAEESDDALSPHDEDVDDDEQGLDAGESDGDEDDGDDDGDDDDDDDDSADGGASMRARPKQAPKKYITIGMIGHPNVGKSSLINGMKGRKVVSTSRTPGHTKHFQTIFISEHVRLCDCPGLVFPILDIPRELQVLVGTYPIAQVREIFTPVRFLAERVSLPKFYNLSLDMRGKNDSDSDDEPARGRQCRGRRGGRRRHQELPELADIGGEAEEKRKQEEEAKRAEAERAEAEQKIPYGELNAMGDTEWSPYLICEKYAIKRGYYGQKGRPDAHRAGREILRDTLDGKIPLRFLPPTVSGADAEVE